MAVDKPVSEELEQRVKFLEKELAEYKQGEMAYRSMVESQSIPFSWWTEIAGTFL